MRDNEKKIVYEFLELLKVVIILKFDVSSNFNSLMDSNKKKLFFKSLQFLKLVIV